VDLGVPGPGPGGQACLRRRRSLLRPGSGFGFWWWFVQAGAVPDGSTFDRLGEVVPQMPPVGDLGGTGEAVKASVGKPDQ
jgi:hypothetical protein